MFAARRKLKATLSALSQRSAPRSSIDARELLGAYASSTLLPEEERGLHLAALDDQELFNALAEEDLFREALADRRFSDRLKQTLLNLNARPATRISGRPAASLVLRLAALSFVIATLSLEQFDRPLIPKGTEPASVPSLIEVPSSAPLDPVGGESSLDRIWNSAVPWPDDGLELSLDRPGEVPDYLPGEQLEIGFSVSWEASVVLLSRNPQGVVTRLFPHAEDDAFSIRLRANQKLALTHIGEGETVPDSSIGRHQLRLVALSSTGKSSIPSAATERRFVVVQRPSLTD